MRIIKLVRMHYHDFMAQNLSSLEKKQEFLYHLNKYIQLRNEVKK